MHTVKETAKTFSHTAMVYYLLNIINIQTKNVLHIPHLNIKGGIKQHY